MNQDKQRVRDFWNDAACGERLYLRGSNTEGYERQMCERYMLEPYIMEFARFDDSKGMRVLEIGVGLGADHQRFAQAGALLCGVDLTERAVRHTRHRMAAFGLSSRVLVGDSENLSFPDGSFDVAYSWGVLHHTPDTPKAILEVHRVLTDGGMARVMIYHKWSLVGIMLWVRYALLRLRPWISLKEIYASYLESPGTKAYTISEAQKLFENFREVHVNTVLTHGDLLESSAGQRHEGRALSLARRVWPRAILKRFCPRLGLFLLIVARK